MATINVQTKSGKRKVTNSKLKKKTTEIANFESLSTAEKWALLADILPALADLLEDNA